MCNAIAFAFWDDDGIHIKTSESFVRVQYTYISWKFIIFVQSVVQLASVW